MSSFDECGVLIPAVTLEDFPSDLSDYDARSLLAAWTVLWHPRLLLTCHQIPTWYRADAPPDPTGPTLLTVPNPSLTQLPAGFQDRFSRSEGCRWVTGSDRADMLQTLALDPTPDLNGSTRRVGVKDFFAVGFAVLQIQVMTRRLRYTSNLDELHLQSRIVAAAEAHVDQRADDAIEALHDVFDCLAEERDHYFASDPHLIDLTLATGSTIDRLLDTEMIEVAPSQQESDSAEAESEADSAAQADATEIGGKGAGAPLATPVNVLIDHEVAAAIGQLDPARTERFRNAIAGGRIGWAGGGPPSDVCLDAMTFRQAETVFREAHRSATSTFGVAPNVYGRFSGSTPADLTETLVRLGYEGVIPLDFAGGSGFGDEAKVILRAGGAEIESLTAKPIDATGDAGFLTLGPRLGEAIDSGEIATALLAHWPGEVCDSLQDLRRVASWSLALGKFWKLDEYFRDGERPYHHGNSRAASADSHEQLDRAVAAGQADPLQSAANDFANAVGEETRSVLSGLASLVSSENSGTATPEAFAAAIGQSVSDRRDAVLLVNPHNQGCRQSVRVSGPVAKQEHLYRVDRDGGDSVVAVDIPACGFAVVRSGQSGSKGFSVGRLFGVGRPSPIAEGQTLSNEFMEVSLSPDSGGVLGVYSGGTRGNRFSLRLVGGAAAEPKTQMRCTKLRVTESSPAVGTITATGQLLDADENRIADFTLRYTLRCGSRCLRVSGELKPARPMQGKPWDDYVGARVAVANESAICRILIRDKIHRPRGRRVVSPLGVLLDEAERQTLISGQGLPYHRRVGDRFIDTLLMVAGETNPKFELCYGFDVSNPVAASKSWLNPPLEIPIEIPKSETSVGWLIHTAPKDVVIVGLSVDRREDGKITAAMRVVQTRPKSCNAAIRFIHEVERATLVPVDGAAEDDSDQANAEANADCELKCEGDRVSLPLSGHQVADIVVVFGT